MARKKKRSCWSEKEVIALAKYYPIYGTKWDGWKKYLSEEHLVPSSMRGKANRMNIYYIRKKQNNKVTKKGKRKVQNYSLDLLMAQVGSAREEVDILMKIYETMLLEKYKDFNSLKEVMLDAHERIGLLRDLWLNYTDLEFTGYYDEVLGKSIDVFKDLREKIKFYINMINAKERTRNE